MGKATLNVDAYMHKTASEGRCAKFVSGFSRQRLKAGATFSVPPTYTDVSGMTQVKLESLADGTSSKAWEIGDVGYIRTAKLKMSGNHIREQIKLNNPALNGVSGSGGTTTDLMWDEVEINRKYWQAIEGVLDLCMTRETNAAYWGPRVKALGAIQVLGGATMLGLGIAAIILSAGAATPLVAALGYASIATTVTSLGGAGAQGRLQRGQGLAGDGSYLATKNATTTTAVAVGVTGAKKGGVPIAVSEFSKQGATQATKAATENTVGVALAGAGGAVQMYGGVKAIRMGNKINPVVAWDLVNWQAIVEGLTEDYIKLQDAKGSMPENEVEKQVYRAFLSQVLPDAEAELNLLIGKITKAIMLSKSWAKGNIDKTKIANTSNASGMPGISWDNTISNPTLMSTTYQDGETISLADAQARFGGQG